MTPPPLTRRGFLGGLAGILAAGVAPAAVGSSILMPVRAIILPPPQLTWTKISALVAMTEELLADAPWQSVGPPSHNPVDQLVALCPEHHLQWDRAALAEVRAILERPVRSLR